ncbi:hypothetical protein D3C76_808800 [compost metagenome]
MLVGFETLGIDQFVPQPLQAFAVKNGRHILIPGRLQDFDAFAQWQIAIQGQVMSVGCHAQAHTGQCLTESTQTSMGSFPKLQRDLGQVHRLEETNGDSRGLTLGDDLLYRHRLGAIRNFQTGIGDREQAVELAGGLDDQRLIRNDTFEHVDIAPVQFGPLVFR